ncbi:MAG: hypothetical protein JNK82_12655 [Myxococcaceae bacterium]|nr:hypothetical protein [Myxococcaceae bacterium]
MSSHAPVKPTDITIPDTSLWAKLPAIGGVLAVIGLGSVLGMAGGDNRARAMFSYLFAFEVFLGFALAALGFLLIDTVARAGWSVVVRRISETMAATLPLFAVLFLPIVLIGYHELYPWTHEADAVLDRKRWFLSDGFFMGRAVAYFIIWSILSWTMYRGSLANDVTDSKVEREARVRKLWAVGAAGVILYALTQSFAAIDWVMSLMPHWYSTIFGVYFFAASVQAYFALMALVAMGLQRAGVLKNAITTEHFHDLGKYTFGFTIFWAYIAFSQFILIWYANIPEETEFYIMRTHGGWAPISYALPVLHFFVPFFFLLSRQVKRKRAGLGLGAAYIIFMYLVDFYWLILPNFKVEGAHESHFHIVWTDIAALVGMGGAFFAAFAFLLKRNKVIAINDPRLNESLVHENY